MNGLIEIIVGLALIGGSLFSLIAALGLIRLKDIYMRMHAASKAGTLGSGLMLLALAVFASEFSVVTRAVAGIVFFLLTAPVSAHLLARAAYHAGYRPYPTTRIDSHMEQSGQFQDMAGTERTRDNKTNTSIA